MDYTLLVKVPKHLESALKAGKIFIDGVVLKDSTTKQIVAHLEQVAPILNVNPVWHLLTSVGTSVGTITINSFQINKILQLVQQLQTLSCINIALSSVNIGVSLVGYYLISAKLDQLSNQLDIINRKIDALIRNENRNLLKETKNLMKNSITLVNILADQGLSDQLELEIELVLDKLENHIEDLIARHNDKDLVSVSLSNIQVVYAAYANLLKSYLTAIYLKQKNLRKYYRRIQIAQDISQTLASKTILKFIYHQCSLCTERLLTEPEIDGIITLYESSCQTSFAKIQTHYEILSITPIDTYKSWQKMAENAYQPIIIIPHNRN